MIDNFPYSHWTLELPVSRTQLSAKHPTDQLIIDNAL